MISSHSLRMRSRRFRKGKPGAIRVSSFPSMALRIFLTPPTKGREGERGTLNSQAGGPKKNGRETFSWSVDQQIFDGGKKKPEGGFRETLKNVKVKLPV